MSLIPSLGCMHWLLLWDLFLRAILSVAIATGRNDLPLIGQLPASYGAEALSYDDGSTRTTAVPGPVNGTTTSLAQETPPSNFANDVWFDRRGVALRKLDVYLGLVTCLSSEALFDWNKEQNDIKFHAAPRFGVDFTGTVRPGRAPQPGQRPYQVKTVMWTLRQIATFMNKKEHFAESRFRTRFGNQVLGTGRVFLRLGNTAADNSTDANFGTTTSNDTMVVYDNPPNSPLTVEIGFVIDGKTFPMADIFDTIYSTLIFEGEHDVYETTRGIQSYNSDGDFSFALSATSEASIEHLTHLIIIGAMRSIASIMANHRPGGQFQEFWGLIKWNKKIVGTTKLSQGRMTQLSADAGTQVESLATER